MRKTILDILETERQPVKLRIDRLILRNFKGIKSLEVEAGGEDLYIYGDNATGKTTVADAFFWLLFNTDSQGRTQFEIKPVYDTGAEVYVEAGLLIERDGQEQTVTLAKKFKEKWTKKRGSTKKVFTGHTTKHYIDGVPAKKKEFSSFVEEIAPADLFRLLTDPRYFVERLDWKDRRRILIELFCDPETLAAIEEAEKRRKVLMERRKDINKELEEIPARIDEVRALTPIIEEEPEKLRTDLEKTKAAIKTLEKQIAQLESDILTPIEQELSGVHMKIVELMEKHQRDQRHEAKKLQKELSKLQGKHRKLAEEKFQIQNQKFVLRQEIERLTSQIEAKRQEWHIVNEYQADDFECPIFTRCLVADHADFQEAYNNWKLKTLEEISKEGKGLTEKRSALEAELADKEAAEKRLDEQLNVLDNAISSTEAELNQMGESYKADPTWQRLVEQKTELKLRLKEASKSTLDEQQKLKRKLRELEDRRCHIEKTLANYDVAQQQQARIEELKSRERELAKSFEETEKELAEIENQVRKALLQVETQVADHFRHTRFKLFHQQINEGIRDVCEVMVNGVPYNSLNNAARILAGLDAINALGKRLNMRFPVFIDNRESITKIPFQIDTQMIHLFVSEEDKILRIIASNSN